MKFHIKIEKEVEATQISICAKCSDCCSATLKDAHGNEIADSDGYVPDWFPDNGGDYVVLDIELATGKILNWRPPTGRDLEEWVKEVKGE
jgi:hypothetical protein